MKKTRIQHLLWAGLISASAAIAQTPPSAPGTVGGMGDPLAIREIRLGFAPRDGGPNSISVLPSEPVPGFAATFLYRGAGVVSGRWEVALPADPRPGNLHAQPDFAVGGADRAGLTGYRVIDTFQESLAPVGRHVLAGPDPARLPRDLPGRYTVLLRITSISGLSGNNPPQPGLVLPRIEYTVLGVAPARRP